MKMPKYSNKMKTPGAKNKSRKVLGKRLAKTRIFSLRIYKTKFI